MFFKRFMLCQSCLQDILATLLMGNVILIDPIATCAAVRGGWRGRVTFYKQSSTHVPKHSPELKAFEEMSDLLMKEIIWSSSLAFVSIDELLLQLTKVLIQGNFKVLCYQVVTTQGN